MPIFNPNVGGSGTPGTSTINVDFIPLTIPTTLTKWTTICNNKMSDSGNFKLVSATLERSTYWAQYGINTSQSAEIWKVFRVQPQNGHTIVALYDSIHSQIAGAQIAGSGSAYRWVMLSAAQNYTYLMSSDTQTSNQAIPIWLRRNMLPVDCISFVCGNVTSSPSNFSADTDYYALAKSGFTQVYGIFVYYK